MTPQAEKESLRERAARAAVSEVAERQAKADAALEREREEALKVFAREMRNRLGVDVSEMAVEWRSRRQPVVVVEGLRIGRVENCGLTGSPLAVETEHGWRSFNSLGTLHEALSYVPPPAREPLPAVESSPEPEVDPLDLIVEGLDRLGLLDRLSGYVGGAR